MSRRRRKAKPQDVESSTGPASNQANPADPADPAAPSPPSTAAERTRQSASTDTERSFPGPLPSLARVMSVVMLIFGIAIVGLLFYRVMAGFFVPLFLAALLVVIFRPVHDWLLTRLGNRARIAALLTTTLVTGIVLLPVALVLTVAASQFTTMVSRLDFETLTGALERGREQFALTLPYPDQFHDLEALLDRLEDPSNSNSKTLLREIQQADGLLDYLQEHVPGHEAAAAEAELARERLHNMSVSITGTSDPPRGMSGDPPAVDPPPSLAIGEVYDGQAVSTAAAIRTWIQALLGGPVRSQLRLLANPSRAELTQFVRSMRGSLQPRFVQVTSATGGLLVEWVIGLAIMVIAFYFFLIDGPGMIRTLMKLSPLDDSYERRLLIQFDRTSRAVVLSSVLSALAQGILAAIAYYFLGFGSVIFLFLITSLMALVPFLGAASVWIPCAIWLGAVEQRWGAALGLAIYGLVLISSIDNVIKMLILHGQSQLHPLLALLSVLGGVAVFGPIGILVGPMVVVFLQTLLEILNHELDAATKVSSNTATTGCGAPLQGGAIP